MSAGYHAPVFFWRQAKNKWARARIRRPWGAVTDATRSCWGGKYKSGSFWNYVGINIIDYVVAGADSGTVGTGLSRMCSPTQSGPRALTFSKFSKLSFIPINELLGSTWYSRQENYRFHQALIQDTRRVSRKVEHAQFNDIGIHSELLHECVGIEVLVSQGLAAHTSEKKRQQVSKATRNLWRREAIDGVEGRIVLVEEENAKACCRLLGTFVWS